ncbi:MAG: acetyltransferase, partial [Nocardioides sp.]|nr:acetyltransferase [Nocardioides sp.]
MSVPISVHHGGRDLAGATREGESWNAAARRVAATVVGEPVAVDLSGETKRFAVVPDLRVGLRTMTHGDLADVIRWRRSDHVHKWWAADGEPTPERVTEQYASTIDGMTPTRMWVAEVNGRSVGFVQDYRLS